MFSSRKSLTKFTQKFFKIILLAAFILPLVGIGTATAQNSGPQEVPQVIQPQGQPPVPGAVFDPSANAWAVPAQEPSPELLAAPNGGPDEFGYQSGNIPYQWVDATGGTNAGLKPDVDQVYNIQLTFPFKSTNSYTTVSINSMGYLQFGENYNYWLGQTPPPSPSQPNNLVIPYWSEWRLASGGTDNQVFYKSFGSEPNRSFVVEWNKVVDYDQNSFSFEVILYENGNIDFSYQQFNLIADSRLCEVTGIEDQYGLDGFSMVPFCRGVANNSTHRITRPASAARVKVPVNQFGSLTWANTVKQFKVLAVNAGDLGADTFEINYPVNEWQMVFMTEHGEDQLKDTNHNGTIDTGLLQQGESKTILVQVKAPAFTNVGNSAATYFDLVSSANVASTKRVTLNLSMATSFAYGGAFYPSNDYSKIQIGQVEPKAHNISRLPSTSENGYLQSPVSLVETDSHNLFSVWREYVYDQQAGYSHSNIAYAVQKHDGSISKAATLLTNNTGGAEIVWDYNPQAAASLDGHVAVTWMRERLRLKDQTYNYNVMLAILDQDGVVIWGPSEVSQNTGWYQDFYNPGYQHFNNLTIAASDDSHFMLAWQQWNYTGTNYYSIDNLYTITYTSFGQQVQPLTNLTNTTNKYAYFGVPDLIALPGSRFLLLYGHAELC